MSTPAPRELTVALDRRVDAMAIAFRIAGRKRYTEQVTPYARAVDSWFAGSRDADLITKLARPDSPAGFSLAPAFAVQLDNDFALRVPLTPLPGQLALWKGLDASYADATRAFATSSKLDDFLASQQDYREKVAAADRAFLGGYAFVPWFEKLFGARPNTRFQLIPGLLNGPMDYAAHTSLPGSEEIYVIAHLDNPDADGIPHPTEAVVPFVVHELCHSFTNPIVDAAFKDIHAGTVPAIARVAQQMIRQAYGNDQIILEESVVRAVVVLWVRDHAGDANAEITEQERLGFVWTRALADALDQARKSHDGALSADAIAASVRASIR